MEDIADADSRHAKRDRIDFGRKSLSKYNNLYLRINTILLAIKLKIFKFCVLNI